MTYSGQTNLGHAKQLSYRRPIIVVTLKISSAEHSRLQFDVSAFVLTNSQRRSSPLVALEIRGYIADLGRSLHYHNCRG